MLSRRKRSTSESRLVSHLTLLNKNKVAQRNRSHVDVDFVYKTADFFVSGLFFIEICGSAAGNRIVPSYCDIRDAGVATSRLKNGSNTLYKQVGESPGCAGCAGWSRGQERGRDERAQFLLNKEVSRTKQLMSLRLGGPARGFVLITSRRESERGEVHGGKEEPQSLFSSFLSLPLSTFFSRYPRPFSVPLSLFPRRR